MQRICPGLRNHFRPKESHIQKYEAELAFRCSQAAYWCGHQFGLVSPRHTWACLIRFENAAETWECGRDWPLHAKGHYCLSGRPLAELWQNSGMTCQSSQSCLEMPGALWLSDSLTLLVCPACPWLAIGGPRWPWKTLRSPIGCPGCSIWPLSILAFFGHLGCSEHVPDLPPQFFRSPGQRTRKSCSHFHFRFVPHLFHFHTSFASHLLIMDCVWSLKASYINYIHTFKTLHFLCYHQQFAQKKDIPER